MEKNAMDYPFLDMGEFSLSLKQMEIVRKKNARDYPFLGMGDFFLILL
jgi:hypothetical protein